MLADAFGQMAFPSMAAAGAAMHAGNGKRAAELAGEALGRLDTTGVNVDEGRVVLAFGLLLSGQPEQALAELLAVDVESSPFALAARATALAMVGDDAAARADADTVELLAAQPDSNVSYWDLWIARIAGVAAGADPDEIGRTRRCESSSCRMSWCGRTPAMCCRACAASTVRPAPRGWADVAAALTARGKRLRNLSGKWPGPRGARLMTRSQWST